MGCAIGRGVAAGAALLASILAFAGTAKATTCNEAVRAAEREHRIPRGLLFAIASVESQMAGRPQPLALNVEGQPHYPRDLKGAMGVIQQAVAAGQTGVAIGCMQIRYDFHKRHFRSMQDLLDPASNVQYAAAFLKDLHGRFGSWDRAVSYYNVGQNTLHLPYLCRVAARLDDQLGPHILNAGWQHCGLKMPAKDQARRPSPPLVMVAASRGWDGLAVIEPKVPGQRFRPVGEPTETRGLATDEEMQRAVRPVEAETESPLGLVPPQRSLTPSVQPLTTHTPVVVRPRPVAIRERVETRGMVRPEGPSRRAALEAPPPPPAPTEVTGAETRDGAAPHFAHLASYGDIGSALTGWQILARLHPGTVGEFAPVIHEVKVSDDRTAYRLLVGAFPSRADADAFCRRLADPRQYCQARP